MVDWVTESRIVPNWKLYKPSRPQILEEKIIWLVIRQTGSVYENVCFYNVIIILVCMFYKVYILLITVEIL